jgi:hypothetical protein
MGIGGTGGICYIFFDGNCSLPVRWVGSFFSLTSHDKSATEISRKFQAEVDLHAMSVHCSLIVPICARRKRSAKPGRVRLDGDGMDDPAVSIA